MCNCQSSKIPFGYFYFPCLPYPYNTFMPFVPDIKASTKESKKTSIEICEPVAERVKIEVREETKEDEKEDSKEITNDSLERKLDSIFASIRPTVKKSIKKINPFSLIKPRLRKSKVQKEMLNKAMGESPYITHARLDEIAKETGLKPIQVYKWFWDHRHMKST